MQFIDTFWETNGETQPLAGAGIQPKESQLKLSLETRNRGDVVIVYCQGRIVHGDEAVALARVVGEMFEEQGRVILELSGVDTIDGAGLGELVLLHSRALAKGAELKCANPSEFVRNLFELTRLDSFLEIHSSLSEALAALHLGVCADC